MPLTILIVSLVVLLFLVAFLLVRTATFSKRMEHIDTIEAIKVDPPVVAEHLSKIIRKPTIAQNDWSQVDVKPFREQHLTLEAMYPRVYTHLERRIFNDCSVLYVWKGRKPELEPVLLMAHLDVVPVEPAGLAEWDHPPFSGAVADGFVWGRGTLDVKNQVITILEAVENLLKEGYRPQRTVMIAFGQDEEVSGMLGAGTIAQTLLEEGIHLDAVLDEGGAIMEGLLPGTKGQVAAVGIAEKGFMSLELVVEGQPGHSSTPPEHTAIGVLAAALARAETRPMPSNLAVVREMLAEIGWMLPFGLQMMVANSWLFGGALKKRLSSAARTNALIRTTQAVTMISGGVKDNLLPREARAVINYRLMPGDSIAAVCEHLRRSIADPRVTFQPIEGSIPREASSVSSTDAAAYQDLSRAIRQIFPDTAVTPYLVLGATDSRFYSQVCDNVYRFSPMVVTADEMGRVHGTNERIAIEKLGQMVQFYAHIVKTWGERV